MTRVADRVQDTGTATGRTVTLSNTSSTGYQTFAAAFAALGYPVAVLVSLETAGGVWEVCSATLTSATNLDLNDTSASSTGAAITWAGQSVTVFVTASADVIDSAQAGRQLALINRLAMM